MIIAVVIPQPGQVNPRAEWIGHFHNPSPVAESIIWHTPNPARIRANHLFCSMGAKTGVKNLVALRDDSVAQDNSTPSCLKTGLNVSASLRLNIAPQVSLWVEFLNKLSATIKKALPIFLNPFIHLAQVVSLVGFRIFGLNPAKTCV
jgi:hypothetical protein